jgi:hypothetical protein
MGLLSLLKQEGATMTVSTGEQSGSEEQEHLATVHQSLVLWAFGIFSKLVGWTHIFIKHAITL